MREKELESYSLDGLNYCLVYANIATQEVQVYFLLSNTERFCKRFFIVTVCGK